MDKSTRDHFIEKAREFDDYDDGMRKLEQALRELNDGTKSIVIGGMFIPKRFEGELRKIAIDAITQQIANVKLAQAKL